MGEQRPQLIDDLERAWAGDCDLLLSLYTEDCRFEDKAFALVHEGHKGVREVFDFSFRMMPDFRVSYGRYSMSVHSGAVEWTFKGSFHGDFEGKVHQGTLVRAEGISFMTLRDDRIVTNTDYFNLAALAAQLKHSPTDADMIMRQG